MKPRNYSYERELLVHGSDANFIFYLESPEITYLDLLYLCETKWELIQQGCWFSWPGSRCALCYKFNESNPRGLCIGCPLDILADSRPPWVEGCCAPGHPFADYLKSFEDPPDIDLSIASVVRILQLIRDAIGAEIAQDPEQYIEYVPDWLSTRGIVK